MCPTSSRWTIFNNSKITLRWVKELRVLSDHAVRFVDRQFRFTHARLVLAIPQVTIEAERLWCRVLADIDATAGPIIGAKYHHVVFEHAISAWYETILGPSFLQNAD